MKSIATSIAASSLLAALTIALAAPVPAQTLTKKYSIPFDFVVSGRTMPAGDYVVGPAANNDAVILAVRNVSSGATTLTLTYSGPAARTGDRDKALLVFHRYGGDCFLAGIWDGYMAVSRSFPMSRTEREKAKTASLSKPEEVMVLVRR